MSIYFYDFHDKCKDITILDTVNALNRFDLKNNFI